MAAKSSTARRANVASVDPIWAAVRREAEEVAANEPALGGFIFATILSQATLEEAVCHRLAQRLNHSDVDAGLIGQTFAHVLSEQPELGRAFRADLAAVFDRDPACTPAHSSNYKRLAACEIRTTCHKIRVCSNH